MKRLMIQGVSENWLQWTEATDKLNREYCDRHDAEYRLGVNTDSARHPSWERIPMFLQAMDEGYTKIAWLDADTLIIDPAHDIWGETDDDAPWQMIYIDGHPYSWTHVYNDGVWVVNANPAAREGIEWVWQRRDDPHPEHHDPNLWSLAWELDYLNRFPEVIEALDQRWNWHPAWVFADECPEGEAWIQGFHGMPHHARWAWFTKRLMEVHGIEVPQGFTY